MAFDSFSGYEQQPVFEQKSPVSSVGKALGRSYLYLGIALLVTALVAFVVGYGLTYWMTTSSSAAPFYVLMGAIIVSFIGMVIISFTMVKRLNSSGKSLWPGFIAYSVLMGICLSSFIIAGIDTRSLLQAVDTAVALCRDGSHGIPVPDYTDENVSTKVVKIIQSYVGIVNKMVWRKDV